MQNASPLGSRVEPMKKAPPAVPEAGVNVPLPHDEGHRVFPRFSIARRITSGDYCHNAILNRLLVLTVGIVDVLSKRRAALTAV